MPDLTIKEHYMVTPPRDNSPEELQRAFSELNTVLTRINEREARSDGGALFGNVAAGNYSEFEADGTLRFHGDATVWDDLRVPLAVAKVPAAGGPNWAQFKDDGDGSTGVFAHHFDDGENIYLTVQIPHGWKEGTNIYPHLHWCPVTDVDPTDEVGIGFEYVWADYKGTYGDTTIITRDVETGSNSAYQHLENSFSTTGIEGAGHTISSILVCRFFRQAAANNNYAGQIAALEIDFHFQKDTIGSREIEDK